MILTSNYVIFFKKFKVNLKSLCIKLTIVISFFIYINLKCLFVFSSKTFFVINPCSYNFFSLLSSLLILLSVNFFYLIIILLWFLLTKFTTITITEILIIPKNKKPKISYMRNLKFCKVHVMSSPKHKGDLIFPCPFGHFDICTEPFSIFSVSFNSFASHFPHVALTDIPHLLHS